MLSKVNIFFMIYCLYTGQQYSIHRATVVTADRWQQDIHSQYFFYDLLSQHRTTVYTGQQSWQLTADSMISTVNIILLFVVSTQYNSHASMLVLSPVYTVQYTVEHTVEYTQYTTQDNSHDSWHHTGEGVNSYIYLHRSPIVPLLCRLHKNCFCVTSQFF